MEGRRRRLAPQLLVGANVGRPGMAVGKRKQIQHCVAVEEEVVMVWKWDDVDDVRSLSAVT